MKNRRQWIPNVAAILGILLTSTLGVWQIGRGNEKSDLAEKMRSAQAGVLINVPVVEFNADDLALRRVGVSGHYVPEYTVLLDNRVSRGVPGYHVITPLKIESGAMHVLINRGWIAAGSDRRTPPKVVTPSGLQHVTGLAVEPSPRQFELSTRIAEGNVWQNLTIARYRATLPIHIQPVVVQQDNEINDGLM